MQVLKANNKFFLLVLFTVTYPMFMADAQTIGLQLSAHPNKTVILLETNGIRNDTLQRIVLDAQGRGLVNLKGIKVQTGLITLIVKSATPPAPDPTFEWVYSPNENPSIVGNSTYIHKQNAQILNSVENQTLDRWYSERLVLKKKQGIGKELLQLYKPTETVYQTLQNEQEHIEKHLQQLSDSIQQSSLFAATYMQFVIDNEDKINAMYSSDAGKKITQEYFRSLDFEKLYHTGLWFNTINGISELYGKHIPTFHKRFGVDIVHNLGRINRLEVYTALADAALSICEANAWTTDQTVITNFLVADNRLMNPTGKLAKIALMQATQIGKTAPDLYLTQTNVIELGNPNNSHQAIAEILPADQLNPTGNTLLVFYQTGCGPCNDLLKELTVQYDDLRKQGWRVISLAADQDAAVFKQTANTLPWPDKYCDYKGFAGSNFKNYAVLGTPTLYHINNEGKIVNKTAKLTDIILTNNKTN